VASLPGANAALLSSFLAAVQRFVPRYACSQSARGRPLQRLSQLRPDARWAGADHPGVITRSHVGRSRRSAAAAVRWLGRLADIGAGPDVDSDSVFAGLNRSSESVRFGLACSATGPSCSCATSVRRSGSRSLPEALARDPITGEWLVGSLAKRKIIRVTQDGTGSDFTLTAICFA